MGTLFIVSNSCFKRRDFGIWLRVAQQGDTVIFIQNGVYASAGMPSELRELYEDAKRRGVRFCMLKEDLEARGLKPVGDIVDYDGFLDLIESHSKIVH